MRKLFLFYLFFSLLAAWAASASAQDLPACSQAELLTLLSTILVSEVLDPPPLRSLSDIQEHASTYVDSRDTDYALLPLCGGSVDLYRLATVIEGDLIGKLTVSMAGVRDNSNPYITRVPDYETRLNDYIAAFSSSEEEADAAENRTIPACTADETETIDTLASEFESTVKAATMVGEAVGWLGSLDRVLMWREESLPSIPNCLEAIEVGILLSKAAGDAAAQFAFRHAKIADGDNPYIATVANARHVFESWRDHVKLTRPENEGATVLVLGQARQLPPCSVGEIAQAYATIDEIVMPLVETSLQFEDQDDAIRYAEAHSQLRSGILSETPRCAEVFEGYWLARQLLGDSVSWSVYNLIRGRGDRNPFFAHVVDTTRQLRAWLRDTEADLDGAEGDSAAPPEQRDLPACSTNEITYTLGYPLINHSEFFRAAFDVETWQDVDSLIKSSIALRDQVWFHMPRCGTALEIGLMIRQSVSDIVNLYILNNFVEDADEVLYGLHLREGLDALDKLKDILLAEDESEKAAAAGGSLYYVTANPYANIRSCASTNCEIVATAQNGEGLTVVDDSSDWYELRLDDGQTAFIAGFLMSKTPPDS